MSLYNVSDLHEQVAALLVAEGCELPHDFGSENLSRGREASNHYTWIPVGTDKDGAGPSRGAADGALPIWSTVEKFDILCDGKTHEIAYLMARNVVAAIRRTTSAAPMRFFGGEWETPRDGEPQLGVGRLYILHLGLTQVWVDAIVFIPTYGRDEDPTITEPIVPSTVITSAVVTSHASDTTDADGELAAVDTVL